MKLTSAFSCWFVIKGADDVGTLVQSFGGCNDHTQLAGMRSFPWGMTKLDDCNFRCASLIQVETWATLFALRAVWKCVHGILIRFDLQKVSRRAYTDDLGWSDGRTWHSLIYQWINSEALPVAEGTTLLVLFAQEPRPGWGPTCTLTAC